MRTRSHMYVRARAPYRANIHAMYRQNAAHGHGNPDRAWEEPSCSSTRPAEIEAWMQKPLRLGTQCKGRAPFHAPVDVVASGGGQGVGSAAPRPAPLRTRASPSQAACPFSSQPCARPLTRGIPETPRMPNAAPHVCACRGRPLVRGACVAPPGSACSRRLCPAVRWSDRAHAAARGNPDESVAADASGASHGARRAHARERCGACWSSAQRAPEPAYARVT